MHMCVGVCFRRQNKFSVIYDTNNGGVRKDRNLFIYMYIRGLITLNAFTPSEIIAEVKQCSDDSTRHFSPCLCGSAIVSVGWVCFLWPRDCHCWMCSVHVIWYDANIVCFCVTLLCSNMGRPGRDE